MKNKQGKTASFDRPWAYPVWIVFSVLAALIFIEGLCSVLYVVRSVHRPLAERRHTQYDAQLGWANIPRTSIPDMYGPGADLTINAQGFRAAHDLENEVPSGKIRLVCSGDSFTFGYGVANDQTWCRQLEALDPRLETVNMGLGGYGLDQAYLWYQRDGAGLGHKVHVFALIAEDAVRNGPLTVHGYAKPYFELKDQTLVLKNVPVPARSLAWPWLTENLRLLKQLRVTQAVAFLLKRNPVTPGPASYDFELALKLMEQLARENQQKHIVTVFVYLPMLGELWEREDFSARLREFLSPRLQAAGIPFLDLTEHFKKVPDAEKSSLYLGPLAYPESSGHYSAKGNALVAHLVYEAVAPHLSTPETHA